MNIANRWSRGPRFIGVAWIMVLSLSACAVGPSVPGVTSWKEEVQLHDGQKIVVQRTIERGGRYEIGQQAPVKAEALSFQLPGKSDTVHWKTVFSQDIGHADFMPLQLDVVKGTAYLVTAPVGCLAHNKWDRPNPPYVLFRYNVDQWQRIDVKELPAAIQTPNLIVSSPDNKVQQLGNTFVNAQTIQTINDDLRQPEYKTILREQTTGGLPACEVLVKYKCGWGAPGEFNRKYFENTCK